jgi:hypothetical protein
MAITDINDYVLLNAKSGVAVFKTYADAPGFISDHFQLTPDGVNTQSGVSYTLIANDNGRVIVFTNGSAVTLTVPSGLGAGFSCSVVQYGAGQVTVAAGSGATLRLRGSTNKTGGQYAIASLLSVVANEYIFAGDTST